jgi:orotate phosphoribosyltransferase
LVNIFGRSGRGVNNMEQDLRQLRDIIRERSLRIGEFILTSGKKSSYYLDCRMTTLDAQGAMLIGRLILDRLRTYKIEADAIGGLTMGADPIATAVAVISAIEGRPLPAFIVRKETKTYGTQRPIEGYDGKPGSRVIVVDDVCTTGGSILTAAARAEEAGYRVVAAFCVVDREEGGTELIAKHYPFYSLFTAKELLKDA